MLARFIFLGVLFSFLVACNKPDEKVIDTAKYIAISANRETVNYAGNWPDLIPQSSAVKFPAQYPLSVGRRYVQYSPI